MNIFRIMDMLVQAPTHLAAYKLACDLTPQMLRELADLAYVEFDTETPRKPTMAFQVVVAGRGMDEHDVQELCNDLGRTPNAAKQLMSV